MLLLGLNSNSKNIVLNSLSNTKDRLHGGLFFCGFEPGLKGLEDRPRSGMNQD